MPKQDKSALLYYTPAIGWGILICYFSVMPGNDVPPLLKSIADYVLHFGIYAALSILFVFGANRFSLAAIPQKSLWVIIFFSSFLGVSLEIIQELFIPGRHAQWSDFIFNSLGTFLVLLLNRIVLK